MQDFLIEEFSLTFEHLEKYYDAGPSARHSAVDVDLLSRVNASYRDHCSPGAPLAPFLSEDALIWGHVLETILEDALCSPLAEIYKQFVVVACLSVLIDGHLAKLARRWKRGSSNVLGYTI
jgi:hypothetical protein